MRRTAWVLVAIGMLAIQSVPAAGLTSASLPGGTSIEVDNTSPTDGDTLLIPFGSSTVDIVDEGTARVGSGAVDKDTTVVYIMDVSGSMSESSGVDCDGVPGSDTRLECEQAGVAAANDAARDPNSPVDETGIGSFEGGANASICVSTAHDVDLGTAGPQLLVAPDYDGDGNGAPDVEDVAASLSAGLATCYFGGLQRADEILAATTNEANIVVFLSDGINNTGPAVESFTPDNFGANTTVLAFALGTGVSCETDDFDLGSLNDIAATSTSDKGSCQEVTDLSELALEVTRAIGSTLESLHISVDGGPFTPIPASDIDLELPANGGLSTKAANYATLVAGLGPGLHEICVMATGTDSGGAGTVEDCKTIRLLQLTAAPPTATNELGVDDTHAVTATVLGDTGGTFIEFVVGGQNAGNPGTCSPNPDCTTDSDGRVHFTYTVPKLPSSLGLDLITVTLSAGGDNQSIELTKEWVDTTPPAGACVETVNPAGKNIPKAPGKGGQGQNQDGFYEIGAEDDLSPVGAIELFVSDSDSGVVFGPFSAGTRIKYTEANGVTPKMKPMAGNNGGGGANENGGGGANENGGGGANENGGGGANKNGGGGRAIAVDYHIWGRGDASVFAIDIAGNRGPAASCLVPPAPK